MNENFKLLLEAATRYQESPIDFYDHLKVTKENNQASPIWTKAIRENLPYNKDDDPYKNAVHFFAESVQKGVTDPIKILKISRDEIVKFMEKEEDNEIFEDEMLTEFSELMNKSPKTTQSKRIYINYEYFPPFFRANYLKNKSIDTFISNSKKQYRTALTSDFLLQGNFKTISFLEKNKNRIKDMGKTKNDRNISFFLPLNLWEKTEEFRTEKMKNMTTNDIARGLYFFIFELLVELEKRNHDNK